MRQVDFLLEGPRAGPADVHDPADTDVNADRGSADEIGVERVGEIEAETEACSQGDGGTSQAAQNIDLRLTGKQEQQGDG